MSELKRTPLHAFHVAHGGRIVDFAGWEMPVQYKGILAEHLAVRRAAGLFDVSHMGEVDVRGPDAARFLNYISSRTTSPSCFPAASSIRRCATRTAGWWTTCSFIAARPGGFFPL